VTNVPVRREPPPFRIVKVDQIEARSPYLKRITLTGPALEGFDSGLPAASVRLLLGPDTARVTLPVWRGNEFLLANGSRPIIRTLTPLRLESDSTNLVIEVIRHGQGPLSHWADTTTTGDLVAVSGPGRGYEIDTTARSFLLGGDESAVPAINTILAAVPSEADVRVLIEVRDRDASVELPAHPRAIVRWLELENGSRPGSALHAAIEEVPLGPDMRVWVAGEAAAMQKVRHHFFDNHELPRSNVVIRGYWKHDRAG
jgi:NADPH-dependent ferric siderophore reductase